MQQNVDKMATAVMTAQTAKIPCVGKLRADFSKETPMLSSWALGSEVKSCEMPVAKSRNLEAECCTILPIRSFMSDVWRPTVELVLASRASEEKAAETTAESMNELYFSPPGE